MPVNHLRARYCMLWMLMLVGVSPAAGADDPPTAAEALEFFEKQVRPVLAAHCHECHGAKSQEGGLRLDSRAAVLRGGDRGTVVVPGKPGQSRLIEAIGYASDTQMPPKGKLPGEAIAALSEWIEQGVAWPTEAAAATAAKTALITPEGIAAAREQHWAFRPVANPEIPAVRARDWPMAPLDYFILSKLEQAGLSPSPTADRRTLLRRASYDLIGLPPSAEEITAFEQDNSPDAFAKVVDRLLASPHYGERWGRHWLDIARYADTKGYVFQEERKYPFAYTYRDYVIRAFNQDLPYDRFLMEQIAADRLALGDDPSPLAALGFLTLGRRFLNNQNDIIDDRIDVVMRGTQAMTVGCARCHDHKYDPIPTQDYYSLHGVFASSMEPPDLPILAPPGTTRATPEFVAYEAELKKRQHAVQEYLQSQRTAISQELKDKAGAYLLAAAQAKEGEDAAGSRLGGRDDFRPQVVRRWQAAWRNRRDANDPLVRMFAAFAGIPAAEFRERAPQVIEEWSTKPDGSLAEVHQKLIRGFRETPPVELKQVADRLAGILIEGADSPIVIADLEQTDALLNRGERTRLRELRKRIEEYQASSPAAPPRAMALIDKPEPVEPRVFNRGNQGSPGERVPRQFLAVVAPNRQPFTKGSGRLELAEAIASCENPLTARVMVNRLWLHHFGVGLVRTPSDFGLRSDPPSHPELLDHLATEFMRDWSLKRMHRWIMLSRTYQQASDFRADGARIDPENRLLWRANRRRLDFESLRDSLLTAAGRLDRTVGGKSFDLMAEPFIPRRTLYGFIDRQNLQSIFRTFDFASPDTTTAQRHTTTIPQQALFLLNSPFVVSQARGVMQRGELLAASDPAHRVRALYQAVLGRVPDQEEVRLALAYLGQETDNAPVTVWQHGWSSVDEASQRVAQFEALPHFTGKAWQGGPTLPDAKTGWAMLTSLGGHAGNDRAHAATRRWTSPVNGVVSISGIVSHGNSQGDGVRARLVSSRAGILGQWEIHNASQPAQIERLEVRRGDTLDFLVDCRGNPNHDSFAWAPVIRLLEPPSAEHDKPRTEWNSAREFTGPSGTSIGPWERLAQVMLLSNEFGFVD